MFTIKCDAETLKILKLAVQNLDSMINLTCGRNFDLEDKIEKADRVLREAEFNNK